jgi:hypothetical protein
MKFEGSIVCLGWGSLIWDPQEMPLQGSWRPDGPALAVEFARQSQDRRLTLVITEIAIPLPVLWATLAVNNLSEARTALARRERIPAKNTERDIGFWSQDGSSDHSYVDLIGAWASAKRICGVIWTALPPKFNGIDFKMPEAVEAVAYLDSLKGHPRALARQYVTRAPQQIATSYRAIFEKKLGWIGRHS